MTGGTQGVGAAIAKSLAQAGADILILGLRDDSSARATLASCSAEGVTVKLLVQDLSLAPDLYLNDLMDRGEFDARH